MNLRTSRQHDSDRRENAFHAVQRQLIARELHVDDHSLPVGVIRSGHCSGALAGNDFAVSDHARLLRNRIVGCIVKRNFLMSRLSSRHEPQLVGGGFAFAVDGGAVGSDGSVESQNSRQAGGNSKRGDLPQICLVRLDVCVERSLVGIRAIDWTGFSADLELAGIGVRRQDEVHRSVERNILEIHIDLLQGRRLAARLAGGHFDGGVGNLQPIQDDRCHRACHAALGRVVI